MRVYLLSTNELVCQENDDEMKAVQAVILRQQALKKLDTYRLEKVHNLKTEEAKNQAIGADFYCSLQCRKRIRSLMVWLNCLFQRFWENFMKQ